MVFIFSIFFEMVVMLCYDKAFQMPPSEQTQFLIPLFLPSLDGIQQTPHLHVGEPLLNLSKTQT